MSWYVSSTWYKLFYVMLHVHVSCDETTNTCGLQVQSDYFILYGISKILYLGILVFGIYFYLNSVFTIQYLIFELKTLY